MMPTRMNMIINPGILTSVNKKFTDSPCLFHCEETNRSIGQDGLVQKTVMAERFQTAKSAELYERACRSLALGVSSGLRRHVSPVPLYFERASGPYFYDADGHEL